VRFELTTARLRIECSTPELLWQERNALERTRTATSFDTTPSRWRVYQFHHQGNYICFCFTQTTGPTGLEPATSRVTVECSNQTELRPQHRYSSYCITTRKGRFAFCVTGFQPFSCNRKTENPKLTTQNCRASFPNNISSPKGNRTPLCTVKGCRPNR
jgi:hypothetical protein